MDIHFSYLSRRPEKSTLRIREVFGCQSLVGSYGSQQDDVFHNYYNARRERTRLGPHYEFANARPDIEDITAFTAEWGVLIPPTPIIGGTLGAKQFEPWMHFYLFIEQWREAQAHFRQVLNLARSRGRAKRGKIVEQLNDRGNHLHINSSSSTEIVCDRNGSMRVVLRPGSLWEAFHLMLLEDLAIIDSRVKRCADPKCLRLLLSTRSDKKFCSADHTSRYHKRKWARKHRKKRKQGDERN